MKLMCILEAAQSETAKRKKEKVEALTKEIVKFLFKFGGDTCYIDTRAKINPCKYQDCPKCRFWDVCGKLWTRFSDRQKVVIVTGEIRGRKRGAKV